MRIQAWIEACLLIVSGKEGRQRGRGGENGVVKEMLDVRLRAPVVDNTMNREYISERRKKKRNGVGRGQKVIIIVEDDGRECTSRKPSRTTNPPPPFLFHIPCSPISSASSGQLSSLLWVSLPPFSKPFFNRVAVNPIRNQTKGHSLKRSSDLAPEAKRQVTGRLPSDSTSLLRISSS